MDFICPLDVSDGHLRIREISGQIPGQQLVDAVDRMIGNPSQDLAQIEFRIESVELGCSEYRI